MCGGHAVGGVAAVAVIVICQVIGRPLAGIVVSPQGEAQGCVTVVPAGAYRCAGRALPGQQRVMRLTPCGRRDVRRGGLGKHREAEIVPREGELGGGHAVWCWRLRGGRRRGGNWCGCGRRGGNWRRAVAIFTFAGVFPRAGRRWRPPSGPHPLELVHRDRQHCCQCRAREIPGDRHGRCGGAQRCGRLREARVSAVLVVVRDYRVEDGIRPGHCLSEPAQDGGWHEIGVDRFSGRHQAARLAAGVEVGRCPRAYLRGVEQLRVRGQENFVEGVPSSIHVEAQCREAVVNLPSAGHNPWVVRQLTRGWRRGDGAA